MGGMKILAIGGGVFAVLGLVAALRAGRRAAGRSIRSSGRRRKRRTSRRRRTRKTRAACGAASNCPTACCLPGLISLTRDMRLKIYDEKLQRQREIPLRAVKEIACNVKKEWMEREWRFKETTSNEKVYTGRSYPVREYLHTITLTDGRKITGPLSAIVYLRAAARRHVPIASGKGTQGRAVRAPQARQRQGRAGTEIAGLRQANQARPGCL